MNSTPLGLEVLRELSRLYPTIDAAIARITELSATLTLPKGTTHIISDVHGEDKKLRHVVNNASGNLRPLVARLFGESLPLAEQLRLLNIIYYPRESYLVLRRTMNTAGERREFLTVVIEQLLDILRELTCRYPLTQIESLLPERYAQVFKELLFNSQLRRSREYLLGLMTQLVDYDKDMEFLRLTSRLVRNLAVAELVVAGDLGDRGPRIDRVIDFLTRQPNVSVVWGNHDVSWLGACLGHGACIATVLRISLRYGRLAQLEEGYGIPLAPLERLARTVYANDRAARFACKSETNREPQLLARMQKAAAVIQFKLEGQAIARNPHYNLAERDLMSRMGPSKTSVTLDGTAHRMLDTFFPTVDSANPLELSPEENECMQELTAAFMQSPTLWQQMLFTARKGGMYLIRDHALVFHGCIPADEQGEFIPFAVDGRTPLTGKELFEALTVAIHRAVEFRRQPDLDLLWYLWSGPLSPLFGKDKIATFELYFLEDKATHHETKNAYFSLIHEPWFCDKVLQEFGVETAQGLIVNGHVPVKIEKGESPMKRSGKAITIDGAFSEAYGDHGYTLVLESDRTYLAQHHHFESVDTAINGGEDVIPTVQEIRHYDQERTVAATERGTEIREQIILMQRLIEAYRSNRVSPAI